MTKLLDQAIKVARALPADEQDEIALILLQLTGADGAPIPLSPEEQDAIAESKTQAAKGEFATDEQVRAVWARHGL